MINSTAPAEASAGVFIRAKVLLEEGAELVEERRSVRDNGGRTGAGTFREELIRISGFAVITGSLLNFIRGELIIIKGGKLQINHYTPAMNHPVHRPRKKPPVPPQGSNYKKGAGISFRLLQISYLLAALTFA